MTRPAAASRQAPRPAAAPVGYGRLDGWRDDDHGAALRAFEASAGGSGWPRPRRRDPGRDAARAFFERNFRPVPVGDGGPALFTGYFEPELDGSRTKRGPFRHPLYRKPPEPRGGAPLPTRAEIDGAGALSGRGLEIAWVRDPADRFFLHVQGSGRIRLEDGSRIRLAYDGKNGHEYRSVGREFARLLSRAPGRVTADAIRDWARRNPVAGARLLERNPSYVFFREETRLAADEGPLGTMMRPLTALRSVAVDPEFVPLGAPVWIEKRGPAPMRRLMIAQDTGSAIRGAGRADIFFGTGDEAGRRAGRTRDPGRMFALLPAPGREGTA